MRLDQRDLYLANWNKSAANTCQSMALIDSIETLNSNTTCKKLLNYWISTPPTYTDSTQCLIS